MDEESKKSQKSVAYIITMAQRSPLNYLRVVVLCQELMVRYPIIRLAARSVQSSMECPLVCSDAYNTWHTTIQPNAPLSDERIVSIRGSSSS